MNRLHLTVLQNNASTEEPTQVSRLFNPNRFDFRWNEDYTAFRPIRLPYWDDTSYLRWQVGEGDEPTFLDEVNKYPETFPPALCASIPSNVYCDDGVPF